MAAETGREGLAFFAPGLTQQSLANEDGACMPEARAVGQGRALYSSTEAGIQPVNDLYVAATIIAAPSPLFSPRMMCLPPALAVSFVYAL